MSRESLIEKLSSMLSIKEASSLLAKTVEKKSTLSKSKRFGLYPINNWKQFKLGKTLEASFWTAQKVNFNEDIDDFRELDFDHQQPLLKAFGFFAVGDGSISSMLAYQMILMTDCYEKQYFYVTQLNNERVHNETYGKMIYTLVSDKHQRDEIFNYVDNVSSIKEMNRFIEQSFTECASDKQLLVSLAVAEYVMFTPLFCIIFWYKAYLPGKLKQIIFANTEIAKDEALHCINGCESYKELTDQYTDDEVHKYVDKIVILVSKFADEVLTGLNLVDLTPENVKLYIRFVADDLFERLGHKPYYNVRSPFNWMEYTTLISKENFYETKVSQYSLYNVDEAVAEAIKLCQGGEEVIQQKPRKPLKF